MKLASNRDYNHGAIIRIYMGVNKVLLLLNEHGDPSFLFQNLSFKIKLSDRNFTQHFDVVMTSLSSDKKITVQQCYICGERCDGSLTYLFKQIVLRGWNPIACSG